MEGARDLAAEMAQRVAKETADQFNNPDNPMRIYTTTDRKSGSRPPGESAILFQHGGHYWKFITGVSRFCVNRISR